MVVLNRVLTLLGLLLLCSCAASVIVEGRVPTPLVSKISARMGVYYADEFRNFRHQETIKESGTWSIDLGAQNLNFFRNLMGSLFTSVTEVPEPPLPDGTMAALDGIITPRIEKYGFLTPGLSGLQFYSASIEYRITMHDREGNEIGDWKIIGYGKSEGGMFSADEAVNEATVLAIRDAGARIAIELVNQPAVRDWLGQLHAADSGGA